MLFTVKFSTILLAVVILSGCQMPGLLGDLSPNSKNEEIENDGPDLTKLVSEEIVIAAAMPITEDGQDDLIERMDDPLPLTVEETTPDDIWERIRRGFTLDHHVDQKRVLSELNWYIRHPDYLNRVATRATRYMHYIVEEIEARNLPMELALLPIVESAFDPFAYSHGRASGLWQFIPSTGRLYGLKIDQWYDGRRDVPAATNAALNYLSDSHKSLNNDWFLSLAAYNSGEGNVRHSMRKNKRAGKPIDFFSLSLFRETRAYVPRLLAISALVANPEKYGITLKPIPNEAYFEQIEIGSQMDLAIAADLADISIEELYLLNPAYNKWATHPKGPHRLLVPTAKAVKFNTALITLTADQRLRWRTHNIKSGESLSVIANRYGTSVATIKEANNIRGNTIVTGQELLVPMAAASSQNYELSQGERLKTTHAIAKRKTGVEPVKYVVRPGDNLWDLSRKFKVSTRSLAKWNGMAPTDTLFPGREILVFGGEASQLAALPESRGVIRKVNYRVRRGESLSRIATKFNTSVSQIKEWNQKVGSQKYIQPGDRLTLYVDVTQAR
ncbi:MAG: membrane-bound lytic murein transglycosylase D [Candidatus Azotimanducaceae bacterium]|jgi:membrane-bound lytic murein transglycosylase D